MRVSNAKVSDFSLNYVLKHKEFEEISLSPEVKSCAIILSQRFTPQFGELWRTTFYPSIRESLGLNEEADVSCRDLLHLLLKNEVDNNHLAQIYNRIETKEAIVFGAGPSLESDLEGLRNYISSRLPLMVAADGAAEALRETGIIADIVASDLDSCSVETLKLCSKKGFVFAHGHGDNARLVRTIVPEICSHTLGTTQVGTRGYIRNFGGFTDGDRACFIVTFFKPSRIILAGMDFGEKEGRYSKNRYANSRKANRALKLEWGKRSLEFLIARRRSITFQNVTRFGVEIEGAQRTKYTELT